MNDMPIVNHNIESSENWDDGKIDLIMLLFDVSFAQFLLQDSEVGFYSRCPCN